MVSVGADEFASYAHGLPDRWELLMGCQVAHSVWGQCTVECVDVEAGVIRLSGKRVALSYFRSPVVTTVEVDDAVAALVHTYVEERARHALPAPRWRAPPGPPAVLRRDPDAERRVEIERFCQSRNIEVVLHFTRAENLTGILHYGLVPREQWGRLSSTLRPCPTDHLRLDGCPGAVSLSIGFPNYRMFYKYRQTVPEVDWVVLEFDCAILWELNCAFYETNAASSGMHRTSFHERRCAAALAGMYAEPLEGLRSQRLLPEPFPSDPQAEVLVMGGVPQSYLRGVCFETPEAMERWSPSVAHLVGAQVRVSSAYFSPRSDWRYWVREPSKLTESGDRSGVAYVGQTPLSASDTREFEHSDSESGDRLGSFDSWFHDLEKSERDWPADN